MFCPVCRAEYRAGFSRCADCDAPLVYELPPEEDPVLVELETVFEDSNPALIVMAKSILDRAGIAYLTFGEEAETVFPVGRVWIQVAKEHAGEAARWLGEIERSEEMFSDEDPLS